MEDSLHAFCLANGVLLLQPGGTSIACAAMTVVPTPFPRLLFEEACRLQAGFDALTVEMIQERSILLRVIAQVSQGDSFTRQLASCVHDSDGELVILRSDYMIDADGSLKQVELNTMSASLYGLATKVTQFHRLTSSAVPENRALASIARSFRDAHALYSRQVGTGAAVILMMVQEDERNVFDQSAVAAELLPLATIRRSMQNCRYAVRADGALIVDGALEVAVVYWRCGYTPADYPSGHEWQLRRDFERSRAIKCPSILTQLAGMKKMQEQWTHMEYAACAQVSRSFARFYGGLGEVDDFDAVVMKPQREGGGNNVYGEEHIRALYERDSCVLMHLIRPPAASPATVFRDGATRVLGATVSELGIFSTILMHQGQVTTSGPVGYLLRTKAAHEREGGFAVGISALDSPALVP